MNEKKYIGDISDNIKNFFLYDHKSGYLWRIKESSFANNRKLPRLAGYLRADGYLAVKFNNKRYLAHRICYSLYHNKNISEIKIIDHLNGIRGDNRIENLMEVSNRQNSQNKEKNRKGKLVGCYYHKKQKKWMSRYKIKNKSYWIGYFNTEILAHTAYIKKIGELNDK